MSRARELLDETNGGSAMGPLVTLSLTVPEDENPPKHGRFKVIWHKGMKIEQSWQSEEVDSSSVIATVTQFMEPFIAHMHAAGFRMAPFGNSGNEVLYDETFDTNGKSADELTKTFRDAITATKKNVQEMRFGRHGQDREGEIPRIW